MSGKAFIRTSADSAAEVCANFDPPADVMKLLAENMDPQQFAAILIEKKKYLDAIDFMAHLLPPREGIWWGCLCMQHAEGETFPPGDKDAAVAAVEWVLRPSEESRMGAKSAADLAGADSIAGILAKAVFISAGEVVPAYVPPSAVTKLPAAKAVAKAVKMALKKAEPEHGPKIQRSYIDLGIEAAEGSLI